MRKSGGSRGSVAMYWVENWRGRRRPAKKACTLEQTDDKNSMP